MPRDLELILALEKREFAGARRLFVEYARDIDLDLSFQNFTRELAELEIQYGPPQGGILLLRLMGRWAGCVAVRRFEGHTAELKRMYVRPAFRDRGYGRRLGKEALSLARRFGYKVIRLDTLPGMKEALSLYASLGFKEIGPYRFNPLPEAKFFERKLSVESGRVRLRSRQRTLQMKSIRGCGNHRRRGG